LSKIPYRFDEILNNWKRKSEIEIRKNGIGVIDVKPHTSAVSKKLVFMIHFRSLFDEENLNLDYGQQSNENTDKEEIVKRQQLQHQQQQAITDFVRYALLYVIRFLYCIYLFRPRIFQWPLTLVYVDERGLQEDEMLTQLLHFKNMSEVSKNRCYSSEARITRYCVLCLNFSKDEESSLPSSSKNKLQRQKFNPVYQYRKSIRKILYELTITRCSFDSFFL
jgi:hypothetical protein